MTEWLSPYLDGELRGIQLHHVEAHLAGCQVCQAELESLARLSNLLHKAPMPEFTSPDRFAAQVSLRLPHQQAITPRKKILELGWWMIPVGLLAIWVFISASFLISDILTVANNLGLLSSVSNWMLFDELGMPNWSATLGQFGILNGNSLDLATTMEASTRASLLQISLQASIALLYLSWIAIWWARQTRHQPQQHSQLLEG
jgi:predicted anti-sigma-YlaC factor YlaD